MKVDDIRLELCNHIGDNAKILYNLGRNKYEEYDVVIKKTYSHVFLVESESREIKSFSYSDVITKTIKIDYTNQYKKDLTQEEI